MLYRVIRRKVVDISEELAASTIEVVSDKTEGVRASAMTVGFYRATRLADQQDSHLQDDI
jgi:hypothetical protein